MGGKALVEGTIVEVCTSTVCWMDTAGNRDYEKIQIKVDDGVIVFPVSAGGKMALVEGTVEELDQTAEQARTHAQEMAEERGVAFDSTEVLKLARFIASELSVLRKLNRWPSQRKDFSGGDGILSIEI